MEDKFGYELAKFRFTTPFWSWNEGQGLWCKLRRGNVKFMGLAAAAEAKRKERGSHQ